MKNLAINRIKINAPKPLEETAKEKVGQLVLKKKPE